MPDDPDCWLHYLPDIAAGRATLSGGEDLVGRIAGVHSDGKLIVHADGATGQAGGGNSNFVIDTWVDWQNPAGAFQTRFISADTRGMMLTLHISVFAGTPADALQQPWGIVSGSVYRSFIAGRNCTGWADLTESIGYELWIGMKLGGDDAGRIYLSSGGGSSWRKQIRVASGSSAQVKTAPDVVVA